MDVFERIEVYQGDITTLNVDAIVNAANAQLAGGGGVDGAIHRAAGPELIAACRKLNGCATGDVKVTPGFHLAAKYVFHAVGPIWQGGHDSEATLLASCYERSLMLASEHNVQSIAFPAISCGVYGYPIEQAINIAVSSVITQLESLLQIRQVLFVCFGNDMAQSYENRLRQFKYKA